MNSRSRLNRLEALAPLLLLLVFGLAYNEIGELAGRRGADYGPAIEIALDRRVPFFPLFIVPYSLFWGYPVAVFAYLYWKLGWEPGPYRRIFVTLVVLIVGCIILWLWFPVRVGLRATGEVLSSRGIPGELVELTYLAATPWNACPSFHVAGSWFLWRTVRLYVSCVTPVLPLLALLIIVSTVLIRIHYLLDIAFGLVISELAFRLVLKRLEGGGTFGSVNPAAAGLGEYAVLAASVVTYVLLLSE